MTDEQHAAILKIIDQAIDAGLYLDTIGDEVVIATGMRDIGTDGEVQFIPFEEE